MISLWRAMKLLLPHRAMVVLFMVNAVLLGAVESLPLLLGRAWILHLEGKQSHTTDPIGRWIQANLATFFSGEQAYLTALCAAILLTLLVKCVLDYFDSYLQGWIANRLSADAMSKLMHHLLGLDIGYFDRRKLGDMVSRMVVDAQFLRRTAKLTLDFLQKPPTVCFFVGLAVWLNWKLFLCAAVFVPLVVLPLYLVTRNIYKYSSKAREKIGDMAQVMLQALSGMRTVQAYGAVEDEGRNFAKLAEKYFRASMRRARNRALQRPMTEIVMGLGAVLVLYVGSTFVAEGTMAIADFLAFIAALSALYSPVRGMIASAGEIAEFVPSAERTFEVLDVKARIVDEPGAVPCAPLETGLAFEDVSFDYGRGPVFEHLNLRIRAGERIGVVGRTGAGKSTLLSLVLRFYDPSAGRLTFDGQDIRRVSLESLRRQVAYVGQDPFLFHAAISENIRYGKAGATQEEIEAAAKIAEIHDEIMELPDKYETIAGERGVTLSGGQRQRIALARAIVRQAPILLLDEATSALDSQIERKVQDALYKLLENRTCLIVAHRLSTLRQVHRIVVFRPTGGIEAVGPHDELLQTSPTYRKLWESHTGQGVETIPEALGEGKPDPGGERRPPEAPRREDEPPRLRAGDDLDEDELGAAGISPAD